MENLDAFLLNDSYFNYADFPSIISFCLSEIVLKTILFSGLWKGPGPSHFAGNPKNVLFPDSSYYLLVFSSI